MTQLLTKQSSKELHLPHPRKAFVQKALGNLGNGLLDWPCFSLPTPQHSNINKMKWQRNTQQVKEQEKCPPNQRGRDREYT